LNHNSPVYYRESGSPIRDVLIRRVKMIWVVTSYGKFPTPRTVHNTREPFHIALKEQTMLAYYEAAFGLLILGVLLNEGCQL